MTTRTTKILALVLAAVIGGTAIVPATLAAPATRTIALTIGSKTAIVDTRTVTLDSAPFIVSGRTMLPLRFISEQMGAGITYTATPAGKVTQVRVGIPTSASSLTGIVFSMNSTTVQVNNQPIALDTAPIIRDGRTFLPVRFIAEQMGATITVGSDPTSGRVTTVTLTFPLVDVSVPSQLAGAGATFPYPLYTKMFDTYAERTGTRVNYQGIGSGGGIKALTDKTVDFGASDAFLSVTETAAMGAPVLHVPTCVGAVVLTYNLENNPTLKFDAKTIADIFLGTITKWNDRRITALNPGVALPDTAIVTVHRSDGSGTTSIFTNYLSVTVPEWKARVGAGKSVAWPIGLGGKGNDGVAGLVKQNKGSVGYVELVYAVSSKLAYATVRNSSGNFIIPSLESSGRAAQIQLPDDLKVLLTNSSDAQAYPIAAFTWLLVYRDQKYAGRTVGQAVALKRLLDWMLSDGQTINETIGYGKLSATAVQKAQRLVDSMTYSGAPLP
jgi:phosphate transport system substrate-binding protein